jgi:hypothetical protein
MPYLDAAEVGAAKVGRRSGRREIRERILSFRVEERKRMDGEEDRL